MKKYNMAFMFIFILSKTLLPSELSNQNTELVNIVKKNETTVAKKILERNYDTNATNNQNETPLMYAVLNENTELVDILLNKNTDIFVISDKGISAPLIAAKLNDLVLLEKMIDRAKTIAIENPEYAGNIQVIFDDVLIYAIKNNNHQIIQMILKKGSFTNKVKFNVLKSIIDAKDIKLLGLFLSQRDFSKSKIAYYCYTSKISDINLLEVIKKNIPEMDFYKNIFLKIETSIETLITTETIKTLEELNDGFSKELLLNNILMKNSEEILNLFLETCANTNSLPAILDDIELIALENNNTTSLKIINNYSLGILNTSILKNNILLNITSANVLNNLEILSQQVIEKTFYYPLHYFIVYEKYDILNALLLNKKIDLDFPTIDSKKTGLILAIKYNKPIMIDFLLKNNIDINICDDFNYPAIYYAALYNNIDLVSKLIQMGAKYDLLCGDENEESLLSRIIKNGKFDIAQKLINNGANVNLYSDNYRITPLMRAIEQNNEKLINLLLSNGAKVNVISKDQESALYIAIKNGNNNIIKKLLEYGADQNIDSLEGNISDIAKNR